MCVPGLRTIAERERWGGVEGRGGEGGVRGREREREREREKREREALKICSHLC